MVPLGIVAFPMVGIRGLLWVEAIRGLRPVAVGIKGVRPAIGESPGVAMEIGVNMDRFVPGLMDMLGRDPIARAEVEAYACNL